MTDYIPFQAHTILTAAELNAAFAGIDAVANGAKTAAAQAETDAAAAAESASNAGTLAGNAETAAQAATTAASSAGTMAAAALPASQVGVANGVAPLGADKLVPAAFLPAQAAASTGGYDAYLVFRGFATTENGVYIPTGIVTQKGISSVDDHGNGVFQINLNPPAPNANFIMTAFGKYDNYANDGTLAIIAEPRRLYPQNAVAPSGPTSGPGFIQMLGGYQGAQASGQLLIYRVGITFTP